MRLLQTGSADLFSYVDFDEARAILEDLAPADLTEAVRTDLADRRRFLEQSEGKRAASSIPWDTYDAAAEDLRSADSRRAAARTLLEFNATQGFVALQPSTKKKLEALLRDRTITSATGSLEELLISRYFLPQVTPSPYINSAGSRSGDYPPSRTAALRILVTASATLRSREY